MPRAPHAFFGGLLALTLLTPFTFFSLPIAPSLAEGNVVAGEAQFRRCSACHQVGPDAQNSVGPQLNGIVGRPIASSPGYAYSAGLSARSAQTWTPQLLETYIPDPAGFIGERSRMPAQRLRPNQLADVIAYLSAQGQ